jgi:hypothetical protein
MTMTSAKLHPDQTLFGEMLIKIGIIYRQSELYDKQSSVVGIQKANKQENSKLLPSFRIGPDLGLCCKDSL